MTIAPRAVLLVQGGATEGESIPLSGGMTMFGRAPLNDIVVDEPGVSRQHSGIRGDEEGFTIADLGSRNGTFVNGERVGGEPRRLKNWDRITLGGVTSNIHWVFMESEATVVMPGPGQQQET